jgi:1,5-anhydro-D-fructose reductase (1,5-anhydro-D-mannitol-forming)
MNNAGFFAGRDVVRWGIIGCGDVTEVKSGPGFQKAAGSQLVAVMRRDATKAADYARRHAVARWYADADALINDPEVDAVYVATPPDTHAHYALKVAAAGKPAYVEKPMARSVAECDQMVAAFAEAKLPLFVAYYRRRMPRFLRVEELLREGRLGRLTGVHYRFAAPFHLASDSWRVNAASAGGGHFLDIGSHVLDLLDYLVGPLANVKGRAANLLGSYAVEDAVAVNFDVAGGAHGVASWNFTSAARDDTLRLTGTSGEITCSVLGNDPVRLETANGVEMIERPNPPHVAQALIQSIVDDLLGRGECPSTGESARRTSLVMDAVLADYYGGRGDEFWAREETWPGRRNAG